MLVPTGQVVKRNFYALGLHRGMVKAAYGLFGYVEGGFATPDLYDQPNSIDWKTQGTGFIKAGYELLPESWWAPGLAVGAENSLWNMAQPRKAIVGPAALEAETYYAVGSWDWLIASWPVEASVGIGTGRFLGRAFGAVGVIPTTFFGSTLKFFGEFAGRAADFGARFALSRNLRLDFAMEMHADQARDSSGVKRWSITLDRGMLGASRISPANWRSLLPAKNPIKK